jgi:hypothetical protein
LPYDWRGRIDRTRVSNRVDGARGIAGGETLGRPRDRIVETLQHQSRRFANPVCLRVIRRGAKHVVRERDRAPIVFRF